MKKIYMLEEVGEDQEKCNIGWEEQYLKAGTGRVSKPLNHMY